MLKKILKKYNDIPIAAKASIWFMFCSVIQKSISVLTVPIFTRLMTTEQYGQYSIYNSWLQIFTIITTLRLNYSVFNKGMSKYKDDRDAYTSTMQTVTLLITTFLFVIYLLFHNQINKLIELPTFVMVAIFSELMVTPAISFWTVRKRYEYIYIPVVRRTLAMAFLNTGLGVVAVLFSDEKGYARIMTCVLVNFCFGAALFTYNRIKGKTWLKKEYAIFALSFNLPLLLHYISQYVLDQFDRIMIQKMVSVSAAALYSVAYNAGLIMKIVTTNIGSALVPWQYEKLEKKDFKSLDNVQFMIYVFVAIISIMVSVFAPEIMMILADKKYHEAVYVIPPVALGVFFLFMYTTFCNVEFFYDQNKFTMYISMGIALLNVGLNYIGIKLFGYIAAAYTTLICYILFCFAHYIYMTHSVKKAIDVDSVFNSKRILLLSATVLSAGILIIFCYEHMIIKYSIVLAIIIILAINRKKIKSVMTDIQKSKKAKKKRV